MALTETYIVGLNGVLRALNALGKEAAVELRDASRDIADRHMVPAWKNAALYYAGPWGPRIAQSVRVRRDRVPSVQIGYQRAVFSGGASSTMVRYPSSSGEKRGSFAPFKKTDWLEKTRSYQEPALREWAKAVDDVVAKWNRM